MPLLLVVFLAVASTSSMPAIPADLAGSWTGVLTCDGETTPVGFDFTPDSTDRVVVGYTLPALHFDHATISIGKFAAAGDTVKVGPFRFALDRASGRMSGLMPAALFPAYDVTVTLRRGSAPVLPPRPASTSTATPAWTFAGDSAMWAGPIYADGRVLVGTLAGTLLALDATTGAALWSHHVGGAIRSRPTVAGRDLYLLADDAVLYKLDASTGAESWHVKLAPDPVARLPIQDP